MRQDIENAVINIIAKHKKLDSSEITPDSLLNDLGLSSLDSITIVYDLEEKFDVEVPNETLVELRAVRDIIEGIATLASEKD